MGLKQTLCLLLLSQKVVLSVFLLMYVQECGYTAPAVTETCPNCSGEMYQRDDDKPETIRKAS